MARRAVANTPGLNPFIVPNVIPTGKELGRGSYGAVEEVKIPGGVCAAKKLHDNLIQLGSDDQVCYMIVYIMPSRSSVYGRSVRRTCTLDISVSLPFNVIIDL